MNKPVVEFEAFTLEIISGGDYLYARLYGYDHPRLGSGHIRTSVIMKYEFGGDIETINTIYRPVKRNASSE